jgi:hypothetical protein
MIEYQSSICNRNTLQKKIDVSNFTHCHYLSESSYSKEYYSMEEKLLIEFKTHVRIFIFLNKLNEILLIKSEVDFSK